jgi:hypothetical protein
VNRTAVEEATETFRQLVIAARSSATVGPAAVACVGRLNALFRAEPGLFPAVDIRWLNVQRGILGLRLAAHRQGGPYARIAKPAGARLDHCWRCETPLDVRFTESCPACSTEVARSLICPVCDACGCQPAGRVVV